MEILSVVVRSGGEKKDWSVQKMRVRQSVGGFLMIGQSSEAHELFQPASQLAMSASHPRRATRVFNPSAPKLFGKM